MNIKLPHTFIVNEANYKIPIGVDFILTLWLTSCKIIAIASYLCVIVAYTKRFSFRYQRYGIHVIV